MSQNLDIFETPVTVTTQQEISKTISSFHKPLKLLNVYFWGDDVYFWGSKVTSGEIRFNLGDSRRF